MEAVPRLPMLSFDLRQSGESVDFAPELRQFIRRHYNEDPDMFKSEIDQLATLRLSAVRPARDVTGCSTLKRYYCQLHFLSSRFPMHEDGEVSVEFSWKNFGNNSVNSSTDIAFEMSSILYNIGALHSQLGASDNRTTADGMKMSCTHFQCAAWAFQHVCEEYAQYAELDLSLDLMSFMAKLCLGQAQECILEKSMMDNRKATIIAKVSVQTVEYYKQALKIIYDSSDGILSESVGSKLCKKWEKYLKFKISYHSSIALLFQGQQAEEQQKMGERVAFYQASFEKLEEANKLSKGLDNIEAVNEALTFVHDVVEGKRKAAKNENEFIYHEDIPDISALPEVKGASLVKGIPFNVNDIEVSGPDIFGQLVPMKAHESSSLYSEEKAKLLRRIVAMVENKDEELETFLSTLQLDELNKVEGNQMPQELIDRCAALSAKPDAVKNLMDSMNKLSNIYHDVENMLTEIRELLKEEEIHEKEYQKTVGKRPPSIAATDLTREAKKYQEVHAKASESNQTLHKAMVLHIVNMKLLSLPPKELINHIPQIVESPEVKSVTSEMKHLLDKVNEMKQQRVMLSGRLRESICQDDILRQVVTYNGENLQVLFDNELQKHQRIVTLIEQNLAAQDNILRALKDAYARYGTTRKTTSEMHRKREAMISSLIASYDAYEDLLAKSSKGLDFYRKLEVNVNKLLQRVKGTCKVQDEEREQIISNVKVHSANFESKDHPSSTPLKLKDYLDMKTELGKLSLDNPNDPSSNPYYKTGMHDQITNQTWMPGIRPAPVGSEETGMNSFKRIDCLPGLYQGIGRDQSWSGVPFANNQNVEDKMKNYVTQASTASEPNRAHATEANSETMTQDIYPISAYSSVMQNTSSTGYTGPKSNYYNTQNSPSRYINPPHFYSDFNQPAITSYGSTAHSTTTTVSSSKINTDTVVQSKANTYTSYGSHAYSATSSPEPVNAVYSGAGYSIGQSDVAQNNYKNSQSANYQYSTVQSVNKGNAASSYAALTQYSAFPEAYNPAQSSNLSLQQNYGQYITSYGVADNNAPPKALPHYSDGLGYGSIVTQASQTHFVSQETNYVNPQNYQAPSVSAYSDLCDKPQTSFYPVEAPLNVNNSFNDYGLNTSNVACSLSQSYAASEAAKLQRESSRVNSDYVAQQYPKETIQQASNFNSNPWQQQMYDSGSGMQLSFANNPNQYLQSGNESLYTACQNSSYALTSSEVYKSFDCQNANYSNQNACPINVDQYYVNQYGSYNGQSEYGLNYGNSATYMQAGTDKQKATTTITYSNSDAKSSPSSEHSNVDLLAGLDFSINQSPLIPETTNAGIDSNAEAKMEKRTEKEERTEKDARDVSEEATDLKMKKEPMGQEVTPTRDSFADIEKLNQFGQEVEKYEKFVESLTLKTLNGPTCLDLKWKEISELQDKNSHQRIISVARCYPMKNRFPDILPYDDSRVELPSTKDDYINASLMKNLTALTPSFILTQAPLPSTYCDFWAMVYEQQVEVVVCLLSDSELDGHIYWPTEKGQELAMGKLKVSLQSSNVKPNWTERIISICLGETRITRVVIHLQLTSWPGCSFPESPGPFLGFAAECINFFSQQRSSSHPVVVHCLSGVGRTGLFCLIVAAILDIQGGKGLPDLVALSGRMSRFRKSCLRDREHLKFGYQAVLYFSQDLLMKRGILTNRSAFDDKKLKEGKCHTRHPSEDFLLGPPTDLGQLQSGIEKLGFECPGIKTETDSRCAMYRSQSVCSRRDSMTNSCASSGRSSPSSLPSDVLATLDPATFTLKLDPNKLKKRKRYSTEHFSKKTDVSLDAFNTDSDDPLSRLDPLWTLKK